MPVGIGLLSTASDIGWGEFIFYTTIWFFDTLMVYIKNDYSQHVLPVFIA